MIRFRRILAAFIVACTIGSLASCGPNATEVADRQQKTLDSIRSAREDSIAALQRREAQRLHREKIEVGKSKRKIYLSGLLKQLATQRQKLEQELEEMQGFQFLRTSDEKRQQLIDQHHKIAKHEELKKRVGKELALANLFNSFDFQKTPEGTLNHIFEAAQQDDFSKLRHLVDPYGEYDRDALQLSMVTVLPHEEQEEWRNFFKNGRIMNDPIIIGDTAEIEVAIGPSSDKLEKFKMLRRMDKWYVVGF